jgi:CheY-like chemotaxis protein
MTSGDAHRARIVMADDHPSVLKAFHRMLNPDFDVLASVLSGLAAIDAVNTLRPDVLIIDLMMPEMDGLEVCRHIKQTAPDTRVIIVTAYDDPHVQMIALQEGASAFVPKYLAPSTLKSTIQRLVTESRVNAPSDS